MRSQAIYPIGMFCYPNKPIQFYQPALFVSKLDLSKWIVQPKWDGHRAIILCDDRGNVKVMSRHGKKLTLAKDNFKWLSMLDIPQPWVLDGELMRSGRLVVWDYAMWEGEWQITRAYQNRLKQLSDVFCRPIEKGDYSIELIESLPAKRYKEIMLKSGLPGLEGFVLKNLGATNFWGPYKTSEVSSQFKFRFK